MSWIPPTLPQQRWFPQDETEHELVVADNAVVLPPAEAKEGMERDLSQNITWGRKPYAFRFLTSTYPAGVLLEENGTLRIAIDTQWVPGTTYTSLVEVRDANNQMAQFSMTLFASGRLPLTIGGVIPDAHFGVPFVWRPIITGGVAPYRVHWDGVNFPALGFVIDETTGEISGTFNGFNSPSNLILIKVWNAGEDEGFPSTGAAAELGTTWNLLNP